MTQKNTDKHSFNRKLKCETCGLHSKEVYHSTKRNKKLCLDCLRDHMIDDIKNREY